MSYHKLQQVILISLAVIFLDQISKYLVTSYQLLVISKNQGMAFGLFPTTSVVSIIIMVALTLFVICLPTEALAKVGNLRIGNYHLALGGVVGGGVSNLLDRLFRGGVVDFINLGFNLPLFNLADLAIVFGVGILLWEWYKGGKGVH